jgi:hypothetical protein
LNCRLSPEREGLARLEENLRLKALNDLLLLDSQEDQRVLGELRARGEEFHKELEAAKAEAELEKYRELKESGKIVRRGYFNRLLSCRAMWRQLSKELGKT